MRSSEVTRSGDGKLTCEFSRPNLHLLSLTKEIAVFLCFFLVQTFNANNTPKKKTLKIYLILKGDGQNDPSPIRPWNFGSFCCCNNIEAT